MKKILMLVLVSMFTLSFTTNAQDQRPPKGDGPRQMMSAKDRADRMAKDLSLTNDQKAKVQALFEKQDKQREKMRAENQKAKEDRKQQMEDRKSQMEKDMKAQDAELQNIIGKEKMAQYQQLRADRMKKMQERRGERRGNDKPDSNN